MTDLTADDTTWEEFHARLARVLADFPERTYLVISAVAEPRAFVQFTVGAPDDPEALWAELNNRAYPTALQDELQSWGFELDHNASRWVAWVGFPSPHDAYARIATAAVAVLRDGANIATPAALQYRAWRDPQPMQPGRTYMPEELDPGARHVSFPPLEIRDQQA